MMILMCPETNLVDYCVFWSYSSSFIVQTLSQLLTIDFNRLKIRPTFFTDNFSSEAGQLDSVSERKYACLSGAAKFAWRQRGEKNAVYSAPRCAVPAPRNRAVVVFAHFFLLFIYYFYIYWARCWRGGKFRLAALLRQAVENKCQINVYQTSSAHQKRHSRSPIQTAWKFQGFEIDTADVKLRAQKRNAFPVTD